MTTLKPWREITVPHEDGRMGTWRYVGFSFNQRTSLILDAALLLIEPAAATSYAQAQRAAE